MVFNFELLAIAVVIVWLVVLSVMFWQSFAGYSDFVRGAKGKTLQAALESLLRDLEETKKDTKEQSERITKLEEEELLHIQKIGLLRFNPFKDTGGDQSFVLALLDNNDTGIVISALYSRLGTRWYAKKVAEGKGLEHELSDEEKKAISEARSRKE
ncbi:MAG: hypothetical protein A3J69_02445 [Candidatus Levybacteria bacterium RIFCSPHIGHO2_02_FULL_42_12]|nr:MAG: hypothetical protein A3J69_02445 [Candidatus Levybacteria bacterium RIFCSPHIGHO2_02_FULL_42_12]OGH42804.1 MAG: hypothetical protein A3B53_01680 [Candidatus Levybacteria bacterium RIFCSPLOWO2_01_FULL_42_15]